MINYKVQITYRITGCGGFQNPKEAQDYIAVFVHKNADTDLKPFWYSLRWHRYQEYETIKKYNTSPMEFGEDCNDIVFIFYKDFDDQTDLILWVQKTEKLLDKYLLDHKDDIQNTPIERERHSIFKKVTKRFIFWTYQAWKEI